MSTDALDQLELDIKRLERDKRIEEIRQLRASGRRQWITPTALAALLPVLAGLGVWVVSEIKQYHEGYRALEERDRLAAEKAELQRQKDSLNIEVGTLLDLKRHYAEQAKDLQARFEQRQNELDATYARARFASAEAGYALGHMRAFGPDPDAEALEEVRQAAETLPEDTAKTLYTLIERHRVATEIVPITEEILDSFDDALALVPVSDWAVELRYEPADVGITGRNVLTLEDGDYHRRYFDVDEERFLTEEEVQAE